MGRCGQAGKLITSRSLAKGIELVIPNPELKLMTQVRQLMRVKHYAIRTEGPTATGYGGILVSKTLARIVGSLVFSRAR